MNRSSEDAATFLDRARWFELMSEDVRARLRAACAVRACERGTVFWRFGDRVDGLYGLLAGAVRLDTIWTSYGPTVLNTFHAGSWLGEAEFLADSPRITTMTALRPCKYLFIGRRAIDAMTRDYPDIWRGLGYLAFEHLTLAVAALEDASIRSSSSRLAAVLVRLCGARLGRALDAFSPDIDVTQAELAQIANLSRSVVGNHLEELNRAGIIERGYGRLRIVDLEALRRTAGVETVDLPQET